MKMQSDRLRAYRSGSDDVGMEQDGLEHSADEDFVLAYGYVEVDGAKLRAMIPEKGFTMEAALEAQSCEDTTSNRPAFLAVLHSLHTR